MSPILITGGAGFIGSHLISKFLTKEQKVICIDDLSTSNLVNIRNYLNNPNFTFIKHDITKDRWHYY